VPFTDDKAHADDPYDITIPVNLKRCGIEMKLIVPNGEQPKAHPITIRALQEAVRKALLWNQALVTGEVASMRELATQEHVAPSYIGTLMRLAFLAPDIIEAIVWRGGTRRTVARPSQERLSARLGGAAENARIQRLIPRRLTTVFGIRENRLISEIIAEGRLGFRAR